MQQATFQQQKRLYRIGKIKSCSFVSVQEQRNISAVHHVDHVPSIHPMFLIEGTSTERSSAAYNWGRSTVPPCLQEEMLGSSAN